MNDSKQLLKISKLVTSLSKEIDIQATRSSLKADINEAKVFLYCFTQVMPKSITYDRLRTKNKFPIESKYRHLFTYCAKKYFLYSLSDIGSAVNRDRNTISHYLQHMDWDSYSDYKKEAELLWVKYIQKFR